MDSLGSKWYMGSLYGNDDAPNQRVEFSGLIELYRGKLKGDPKIFFQDFKKEENNDDKTSFETNISYSLLYPKDL